jgi:hypothetical protein
MSSTSSPTVVEAGIQARLPRARALPIRVFAFDRPALWLAAGAAIGVGVAGMWNVRAIDGLGVATFVVPLVGPFQGKAAQFAAFGPGFGALFAVAAGLAATATASSLATFTLLPGLASSVAGIPRASALKVPAIMAVLVATVGALYGAFIGRMGPEGAAAFNTSAIRSAQSFVVFGALGSLMLIWAAFEARLLAAPVVGAPPIARIFLAQAGRQGGDRRRDRRRLHAGAAARRVPRIPALRRATRERRLRRRRHGAAVPRDDGDSDRPAGVHGRARTRPPQSMDAREPASLSARLGGRDGGRRRVSHLLLGHHPRVAVARALGFSARPLSVIRGARG